MPREMVPLQSPKARPVVEEEEREMTPEEIKADIEERRPKRDVYKWWVPDDEWMMKHPNVGRPGQRYAGMTDMFYGAMIGVCVGSGIATLHSVPQPRMLRFRKFHRKLFFSSSIFAVLFSVGAVLRPR